MHGSERQGMSILQALCVVELLGLRGVGCDAGEPMLIKKAVCMHEEDAGMLWKHVEYRTNHSEVRRSRRLVLSFVATVRYMLGMHAIIPFTEATA